MRYIRKKQSQKLGSPIGPRRPASPGKLAWAAVKRTLRRLGASRLRFSALCDLRGEHGLSSASC
ncbi:hypothetical protein Celaphus_00010790 [Cervus elaphus hippelaphus]|uniref:Uncharacterized protein n=1 Tax=Cervus elaphus hippelaphus TaxID=46360 RepID=A0A212CRW3_CEREH|nr:hypothetical protein Celaphus_00010790 [Cervus elaphus hippelaphus]